MYMPGATATRALSVNGDAIARRSIDGGIPSFGTGNHDFSPADRTHSRHSVKTDGINRRAVCCKQRELVEDEQLTWIAEVHIKYRAAPIWLVRFEGRYSSTLLHSSDVALPLQEVQERQVRNCQRISWSGRRSHRQYIYANQTSPPRSLPTLVATLGNAMRPFETLLGIAHQRSSGNATPSRGHFRNP